MAEQTQVLQQSKKQDASYQVSPQQQQTAASSNASAKNEQMTQGSTSNLVPMEKGCKDKARVLDMQRRLVDLGFSTNGMDGDYGNGTVKAVQSFQSKYGLTVSGKADLATLRKLYELVPNPSIGALSAKYESRGGDNSVVAYDSHGGTSYGKYQLAAKVGAMTDFVKWLKSNGYASLASKLEAAQPYDTGSSNGACPDVWRANATTLEKPVEDYVYSTYYTNAVKGKSYKDFIDSSSTLRDAFYSASINHGAGGADKIVKSVYSAGMSKEEFIKAFYARRKTYVKGNKYEEALCNRYTSECSMALGLLALEEQGLISNSHQLSAQAAQTASSEKAGEAEDKKAEVAVAAQNNDNIEKVTPAETTKPEEPVTNVTIYVAGAVRVNKSYGYSRSTWKEIQRAVGLTGSDVDGYVGPVTAQAIANWQAKNGLVIDGMCGSKTLAAIRAQGNSAVASAQPKVETKPEAAPEEPETAKPETEGVAQDKTFKYFSFAELTYSDTARAQGIDNSIPDKTIENNLSALILNCLDPIRGEYGGPIRVNSGYRCPALNKAVGGVDNSQHKTGQAADITVGSTTKNKQLIELIKKMHREQGFQYDQLIDEYGAKWIHISYKTSGNRNQNVNIT